MVKSEAWVGLGESDRQVDAKKLKVEVLQDRELWGSRT